MTEMEMFTFLKKALFYIRYFVILLENLSYLPKMNMLFDFYQNNPSFFFAVAVYIPLAIFWNYTRRKDLTLDFEIISSVQPLPLSFGILDYVKAVLSWIFLFSRLFYIKPGFYFTGEQNENSPILVTSNNFLTVFLLARRISDRNVRLLVINTYGINVWCSAAEGRFSTAEIICKAKEFGLINEGQKTDMILPKLCLSGVKLSGLHKAGIRPIIGPIYARDVPEYLDGRTFKDRISDRFHFGFQSRCFTALPTSIQFFYYFLGAYIFTFWMLSFMIIPVATVLAFLYPVLFPYLPGKKFAVKGISLSVLALIFVIVFLSMGPLDFQMMSFLILFILATSIFIALSYTGNSPVSNYDNVRKETAQFLPVVVILYLFIIPVKIFL